LAIHRTIKVEVISINLMLYSESTFSSLNTPSLLILRNWVRSGLFLMLLILATVPLTIFALLSWKLESQMPTEN